MKQKRKGVVPVMIAASATIFAALLLLLSRSGAFGEGDLFTRLDWILYDVSVRAAAGKAAPSSAGASHQIAFVAVSNDSQAAVLDGQLGYQYGLYWPRHVYGRALRELANEGVMAVGFDVMFYDLRPDHLPVVSSDGVKTGSDEFFAAQIRNQGRVVLAANQEAVPPELFRTNSWSIGDVSTEKDADAILRRARAFVEYRVWHPAVLQQARALDFRVESAVISDGMIRFPLRDGGNYELPREKDGSIKLEELTGESNAGTAPPFRMQRVWQLGLTLAAAALQLDLDRAEVDLKAGSIRIPSRQANGVTRVLPVDEQGRFYIDWTHPFASGAVDKEDIKALLARDVLRQAGETAGLTNRFQSKLVIIGSTSTGNELTDLGATPLDKETFLVSKHWNVARSFLDDRFIRRAGFHQEFALLVFMGIMSSLLAWKIERPWLSVVAVLALMIAAAWGSVQLFGATRIWMPVVLAGGVGSLFPMVSLEVYKVAFEQKERRRVRSVFSKIVSPDVVQELLAAEKVSMGGAQRELTIFFADVRGFTEFTDNCQAVAEQQAAAMGLAGAEAEAYFDRQSTEALNTVNLYLSVIADTIKKHQGTLDKYIGDCVMAFWGAPGANPLHAAACVRAAIDSQRAIHALNTSRFQENKKREERNLVHKAEGRPLEPMQPLLKLGTGINTGKVTVGLMGSEDHILNYTVFGREVNLASRLEGVSGRDRIVISEATYLELNRTAPDLAELCQPLPPVTVKGIRAELKIYKVAWEPAVAKPTTTAVAPQGAGG